MRSKFKKTLDNIKRICYTIIVKRRKYKMTTRAWMDKTTGEVWEFTCKTAEECRRRFRYCVPKEDRENWIEVEPDPRMSR
jgi:hypothetical protein